FLAGRTHDLRRARSLPSGRAIEADRLPFSSVPDRSLPIPALGHKKCVRIQVYWQTNIRSPVFHATTKIKRTLHTQVEGQRFTTCPPTARLPAVAASNSPRHPPAALPASVPAPVPRRVWLPPVSLLREW